MIRALFLAAGFVLCALPAQAASPTARIQDLAKRMTFEWAASHPFVATELGIPGHDGEVGDPSAAAHARDLRTIRGWIGELAAIDLRGASLRQRDDARLLQAQLTRMFRDETVYRRFDKDYSAGAQAVISTLYTQFLYAPIAGLNGATKGDVARAWDDITHRVAGAPAYIRSAQREARHPGHLYGVVGSQQLAGAPDFLGSALTQAARSQMAPARFRVFLAARDRLLRQIAASKAFIDAHVASWPENYVIGRAAYEAMLRDEQLLPYSASDIAQMGRDELAHGWADQLWAQSVAHENHTPLGPQTGGGMAPAGKALIPYYRELLKRLRDFVVERDVVTVPAWLGEVQVVETPAFLQPIAPGPSNRNPRIFAREKKGIYFITPIASFAAAAKRLDLYEDFDRDRIWSSAAHETIPGHFMQFSIAHRNPDFVRRVADSAVFAEGWAYYGEEMFLKLGLYGDDLDARVDIAQWERIRGCRAIVDGNLATGTWSFAQAVDFFQRETGATHKAAVAGVADIALDPGYVVSYTAGRLQLENLFAAYHRKIGARGSLHDFNDRLLSYGTVPFSIVGPELLADLKKPAAAVRAAAHY
ncbi:MAG: DUF885 domain-containing protein [Candidatus Eremiobacteraeota bacterium]|nr:DUF885 domain-containing protein [Candidatus Eremiobacteraeota bacterium]